MIGRVAVVVLLALAVLAGGGLYYLERFHWYDVVEVGAGEVTFTAPDGTVEALPVTGLRTAVGESSPLKYRACFTVEATPEALAERFVRYPDPEPTVAPRVFPCFDEDALASALASGDAIAFMGQENVTYGIDRVVAVGAGGTGHAWHQINRCGARVFDGDPPPEGCPPPPATE